MDQFLKITVETEGYRTNRLTRATIRLAADACGVQWPRRPTRGMGDMGQSRLTEALVRRFGTEGEGNFGALEHIAGYVNMCPQVVDLLPWSLTSVVGTSGIHIQQNGSSVPKHG